MTFLSSRVIGRGSTAPPADVALITDAFLSSFIFGPRQPEWACWCARTLIPPVRRLPKRPNGIGAAPQGQAGV